MLVESRFLYFRIILVDWMPFFCCFNQLNFVLIHLNPLTKIPWFFSSLVPCSSDPEAGSLHWKCEARSRSRDRRVPSFGSRWIGMGQMSICHLCGWQQFERLLHFASTMLQQKSSCSQQDKYWAKMADDQLLRPARLSRTQISAEDRLIRSVD